MTHLIAAIPDDIAKDGATGLEPLIALAVLVIVLALVCAYRSYRA
jgi:hypothetical protein